MKHIGELNILGGIAEVFMTEDQKIEAANNCKNGALVYAMEDGDGILSPVATDDADMRAAMASMREQLRAMEEDARYARVELDAARDEAKSLRRLNDDYAKEIVAGQYEIDNLKGVNIIFKAERNEALARVKELEEETIRKNTGRDGEWLADFQKRAYENASRFEKPMAQFLHVPHVKDEKPSLMPKIVRRVALLSIPVYLISAFIPNNWNVWEWTPEHRSAAVLLYGAFAVAIAIVSVFEDARS